MQLLVRNFLMKKFNHPTSSKNPKPLRKTSLTDASLAASQRRKGSKAIGCKVSSARCAPEALCALKRPSCSRTKLANVQCS